MITKTNKVRLGIMLALAVVLGVAIGRVRGVVLAADGEVDPTFNGTGKVTTDYFGKEEEARAIAIQRDGKIVVVGNTHVNGDNWDFAVARYNPNGTPDLTFSQDGKVNTGFTLLTHNFDYGAYGVPVQDDDKIVVVGTHQGINVHGNLPDNRYFFGVAPYNPDGSLDNSFGDRADGRVLVFFANRGQEISVAKSVAIQKDGRIVVAGYTTQGSVTNFALARLIPNGTLDDSFDLDGKQTIDLGGIDKANAVVIQSDGKIVAAGFAPVGGVNRFALVRFNPIGSVDFGFGKDGVITTAFGGGVAIATR